ncbi:hypothetical protein GC169_11600 [bacterium]|nr:hypothetical protein [bacterium]
MTIQLRALLAIPLMAGNSVAAKAVGFEAVSIEGFEVVVGKNNDQKVYSDPDLFGSAATNSTALALAPPHMEQRKHETIATLDKRINRQIRGEQLVDWEASVR